MTRAQALWLLRALYTLLWCVADRAGRVTLSSAYGDLKEEIGGVFE